MNSYQSGFLELFFDFVFVGRGFGVVFYFSCRGFFWRVVRSFFLLSRRWSYFFDDVWRSRVGGRRHGGGKVSTGFPENSFSVSSFVVLVCFTSLFHDYVG